MARLLVDEEGSRRVVALADGQITIGRGTENAVIIRDPKSSRNHCRVVQQGDAFFLEDLNSSNGTLVNDTLARRESLQSGDVISIGQVHMTFVLEGAAPTAEAEKPAPEDASDLLETMGPDDNDEDLLLEERSDADSSSAEAPAETPYLEFVGGEREGEQVEVTRSPFTIGRKAGNDLVISDARVSGLHARITDAGGLWRIEDCDSGNGLTIGKQRVKKHILRTGELVGIGNHRLRVGGVAGPTATPRPASPRSATQVLGGVDEGEFSEEMISRLDVQHVLEQSSPYQAVFTTVFVAALLAVLYLGWSIADRFVDLRSGVDAENLLRSNPSFENVDPSNGAIAGWRLNESAGRVANIESVVREPRGRHGLRVLRLNVSSESPGGFVRVESELPVDLSPGQGLRVAGQIRNVNFPLAAIEVIWLARSESTLVEVGSSFSTPIRPGQSYRSLTAVVHPPAGITAERARVAIFARGTGSLEADDLSLKASDEPAAEVLEQTLTSADESDRDLVFSFSSDGSFSLSRGKTRVARSVRFAAPTEGEVPFGQLVALNTEPPTRLGTGGVRTSFDFLAARKSNVVVDQLSQTLPQAQRIRWQLTSDPEATSFGLAFELEERAASRTMAVFSGGVRVAAGKLVDLQGVEGDEWVVDRDARQIIFSLSARARFRVLPVEQCRGGRPTVFLGFVDGIPQGVLELFVSPISTREQERIASVFAKVDEALVDGRGGEAFEMLRGLEEQFDHLDQVTERAGELRAQIESKARGDLAELEAIRGDLERYGSGPVRELLFRKLDAYRTRYAGLAITAEANALAAALEQARTRTAEEGSAKAANDILQAGMDHYKESRDQLARFYFQWVLEAYPESPEAKDARQQLEILKARYGEKS